MSITELQVPTVVASGRRHSRITVEAIPLPEDFVADTITAQTSPAIIEDIEMARMTTTVSAVKKSSSVPSLTDPMDVGELGPELLATSDSNRVPTMSSELERKYELRAHLQLLANCWSLFLAGWNDGTTGPLLPRMQEVYGVRVSEVV